MFPAACVPLQCFSLASHQPGRTRLDRSFCHRTELHHVWPGGSDSSSSSPSPTPVAAASRAQITLARDISSVGSEGSTERAAFVTSFQQVCSHREGRNDMAAALSPSMRLQVSLVHDLLFHLSQDLGTTLNIDPARVEVYSVTAGCT